MQIQTLTRFQSNIDCITKPLSIKTIWKGELSDLNLSVDWEKVWSNLSITSKNLAHHLIHFKVIHRAYITPYKRFKMKLQPNLNCHICNTASSGTFLHMFWECPVVIRLWTHVNLVYHPYYKLIGLLTQVCVFLMMILVSVLVQCKRECCCWFYSCEEDNNPELVYTTRVEKTYWIRSLLQIVTCECTTARINGAKPLTIDAWQCFLSDIRDCIKD